MHEHKLLVRYFIEIIAAILFYFFVLVFSLRASPSMPMGFERTLVSFSPMVPVLLMLVAVFRYFRRVDEYLRIKILENWAMTAVITALWTFTYGFLEGAGFPRLSMTTVFPVMGLTSAFLFTVRRMAGR
jgi:hypothetical protein